MLNGLKKNAPVLVMDISNSWTKCALVQGERLHPCARIATARLTTRIFSALDKKHQPRLVVIGSVVPKALLPARKIWRGKKLLVVSDRIPLPIKLRYPDPHKIGADRIANAVAAAQLYPLPAIAVDSGTAVTFDIISKRREYLGGVIAPGLNAMTDYLHEKTALLPKITISEPPHAIGKSTEEAMRIGALIGYRGLIKGVGEAIKRQLKSQRITVVATGGHAALIAQKSTFIQHVNPLLTLQGLQFIAEYYESNR